MRTTTGRVMYATESNPGFDFVDVFVHTARTTYHVECVVDRAVPRVTDFHSVRIGARTSRTVRLPFRSPVREAACEHALAASTIHRKSNEGARHAVRMGFLGENGCP